VPEKLAGPIVVQSVGGRSILQRSADVLRGEHLDALIALLAAAAIVAHLVLRYVFRAGAVDLLPLYIAVIVGGVPILVKLLRQALTRHFGSDMLAGFSIVTGVLLHEYLVACIVVLMLSGGSALEQSATRRASSALRALAKRMPATAHLVTNGRLATVNARSIVPGNVLAVFPHEVSPVDGEVVEGYSEMDESYLTGEPFRIRKAPGSHVLSGAVNGNAALKIRATKLPVDSRYSHILKVVGEAERHRPEMSRIADRLGAWYTPAALLIAIVGWVAGGSAERFLG
jgi:cation transport ATPase